MDDILEAERRQKNRERARVWSAAQGEAGRKKARDRRAAYIQAIKDAGRYEEFKKEKAERERKYYWREPELTRILVIDRQRRYRAKNWAKIMFNNARSRAKEKGLPFSIELSDIVIPDRCPVLDIPITKQVENLNDNSPSVDRIRPALGYVKGNVRVISQRANRLKCDGTAAEMLLVHRDLLRIEAL
jgi:hypothetical protein